MEHPHQKKDITKLEKVQRDIARRVPGLQGLTYEKRLEELGITTLEKRRERGDAISMYNCVTGKQFIHKENFVKLSGGRTRGHRLKVQKGKGKKNVKKYSFPNRANEGLNRLPAEVTEAKNIGDFKKRYDEHMREGRKQQANKGP